MMKLMRRILRTGKNFFGIRQNNKKLNYQLSLKQDEDFIYIGGQLGEPTYLAKELWFYVRGKEEKVKLASIPPSNTFNFKLPLSQLSVLPSDDEGEIFDLYMVIQTPKDSLSEEKYESLEDKAALIKQEDGRELVEYPIRLGRFQYTEQQGIKPFVMNNRSCAIYVTNKGNISFSINRELKPDVKTYLKHIKIKKCFLQFGGRLFTRHSAVKDARLVLVGRDTGVETFAPVHLDFLQEATKQKYGLHRYFYRVQVDLNDVFMGDAFTEDVYDAYLELEMHDYEGIYRARIGKPSFFARYFLKAGHVDGGNHLLVITPYFTFKGFNLSFQADTFERDTYFYLKKMLRWAWLLRLFYRRRQIWLVGERPYKAQDTGFHFFKYMRTNHPKKHVYYVIEEDSPELKNVEPYGNILFFKSKEHIWHTLMATKVIGSHHPDYLYPLRTKRFKKAVKAIKVFLQHGVMGTKNMVANYGKSAPGFDTDLFIVSSDFEKNMIVNDFGYDPHEVVITGLSRYDRLFANDIPVKRQILIIPTWRDWIITDELFLESEYFEHWKRLVFDPTLHRLAEEFSFEIVFCLHPNMQKFTSYFSQAPVRVISQGEVDVQTLIKESIMMVTDYSSVGFDFSFLHKPIVYYQFDREHFIGKRPSHFDLDNDLPGDIVFNHEALVDKITSYTENGFRMLTEFQNRAEKLLKYRDQGACERIYHAVTDFKIKKSLIEIFAEDELVRAICFRFRKSRFYFPTMKFSYSLMRRVLPVDKKLIVFESGVGKQYADSPRAIYEEIIRRNLDYQKIWICNQKVRFLDPKTKQIKRLSPQYYYYLAKARYWINNQNFPTYIKKRKQTTYIQTWHGTPLKKMLFDIEEVQGRDERYLEHVYNATKTWDYLISPSAYASDAFRSAFRYMGEILETGYPRNDIFYRPEKETIEMQVRNRLNLPSDKKIILYAPTFRDNQTKKKNKFVFDIKFDFEKMKQALGDDFILLLRMHVVISNNIVIPEEYREFIKNVSKYPDIQELYLISDLLITDYSSVMFDFANSRRPILFYTYDLEEYRDDLRGFYMDFEQEAPGPLLQTTEEVIEAIQRIDDIKKDYQKRYDAFYQKYCGLEDGHASERVVDVFFGKS
ncbi:CDP-glycerol glycerophosphotransferase family protein [Camelliibacillus cellulosilyticus]|uniref:CDP-glycerol glycerophosphotransferase family protein n=1 Tax=Camelliibacillus cellulosilyticus TaxID=2174486 RepID=A0ABV9GTU2_9BACL